MQRHAIPINRTMHTKSFSEKEGKGKLGPDRFFFKGTELVLRMRLKSKSFEYCNVFWGQVNFVR